MPDPVTPDGVRAGHGPIRPPVQGRPPAAAPAGTTHPQSTPPGTAPAGAPAPFIRSLPDAIHRFKSFTTAEYRRGIRELGWPPIGRRFWLGSYWDDIMPCHHVPEIDAYIRNNPSLSHRDHRIGP